MYVCMYVCMCVQNISEHYDLGNDMYKLFLDNQTWMYSSGVFNTPVCLTCVERVSNVSNVDVLIRCLEPAGTHSSNSSIYQVSPVKH
jgi:hypothetical protein